MVISLVILSAMILLVQYEITVRRTDRAIFTFDSAEYAVAGRNLARTGALETPFVHPDALYGDTSPPFPYMVGHPMVPVLNAMVFLAGAKDPAATLIPPGLSCVVLVSLTALFAFKASGSRVIALLIGGAVALHPDILYYASEGLSEIPFTAAFVGAVILLRDMGKKPRPVALGLVLGAAQFTRPMILPVLPFWLAAVAMMAPERRWRTAAKALGGFLPWAALLALHRFLSTGNPFADIGPSRLLTGISPEMAVHQMHRYLSPPSPLAYLRAHPDAFLDKILTNAPRLLWGAFTAGGTVLGALFLLYLLSPARDRAERIFRGALLVSILALAVLGAATVPSTRHFLPFVPVYLVLTLSRVHVLFRSRRLLRDLSIGATAVFLAFFILRPTLVKWRYTLRDRKPDRGVFTESEWRDLGAGIRDIVPEGAVTTSDVAPWISWYADRYSVLLPVTPAENDALDERMGVDAIVLTNEYIIDQPGNEEWKAVFDGERTPEYWRTTDIVRFGTGRAVVLKPDR